MASVTSTTLGRSRSLRVPGNDVKPTSTTNPQNTAGPSNMALFLTNLRLLDLDLWDDWPDITALTFSTKDAQQNQKKRIQCVEWAIYRLFAIWDPEETRNVCITLELTSLDPRRHLTSKAEATALLSTTGTATIFESESCSLSMP